MPTRVTTSWLVDSAASVVMHRNRRERPGPDQWADTFLDVHLIDAAVASAAKKTARCGIVNSGDFVASAVAMAAVVKPPVRRQDMIGQITRHDAATSR